MTRATVSRTTPPKHGLNPGFAVVCNFDVASGFGAVAFGSAAPAGNANGRVITDDTTHVLNGASSIKLAYTNAANDNWVGALKSNFSPALDMSAGSTIGLVAAYEGSSETGRESYSYLDITLSSDATLTNNWRYTGTVTVGSKNPWEMFTFDKSAGTTTGTVNWKSIVYCRIMFRRCGFGAAPTTLALNMSRTSGVVTATNTTGHGQDASHGLVAGDTVVVSAGSDATMNGTVVITGISQSASAPDGQTPIYNQFTYVSAGADGTGTASLDTTNAANTKSGAVYLDALCISARTRAKITFSFDDAYYPVIPVAAASLTPRGWLAGVAITSTQDAGNIDTAGLKLAEVSTLYNQGWDVTNHSRTHTQIILQPLATAIADVLTSKSFALSNGWTRGNNIMTYVGGGVNQVVIDSLTANGFVAGFMTNGVNAFAVPTWQAPASGVVTILNPFRIPRLALNSALHATPASQVGVAEAYVDAAINNGTSIHFYGHNFSIAAETGTAQAGTQQTITLAASSNAADDYYRGQKITLTGGTGSGQVVTITGYNGTTKVANTSANWSTQPNATTTYSVGGTNDTSYWPMAYFEQLCVYIQRKERHGLCEVVLQSDWINT